MVNDTFASVLSSVIVNGKRRDYYVQPLEELSTEKTPLLLVLHGGGGNARAIEAQLNINQLAHKHEVFVAYLNGTGGILPIRANMRTWNAGNCFGRAVREKVNDVVYITAVIESIAEQYPVDINRVYLTGHSNGAMMAYRYICVNPNAIAGIVAISGTLLVECNVSLPPVLHIHGELDANAPINGGVGVQSVTKAAYPSVKQTKIAIENAGGSFSLKIIKGAGHKLSDLNAHAPIGEFIFEFINEHRRNVNDVSI